MSATYDFLLGRLRKVDSGVQGPPGPQGEAGAKGDTGTGITEQTVGFTLTGGTTPKTLTVALDANVSGTNTGDQDLSGKVDKVTGKGLSTEDYTTAEKSKLSGIEAGANNYSHPSTHSADIITDGTTNKAYTAAEKTKLTGIAEGANNYILPIAAADTLGGVKVGSGLSITESVLSATTPTSIESPADATAEGGSVTTISPYTDDVNYFGGEVLVAGGNAIQNDISGGSVGVYGGTAAGGNASGGSVELVAQAGAGTGENGQVRIMSGGSTAYAVLNTESLSENKTFTFPDASGTFSLDGHTHDYEPASSDIQAHLSSTLNPHSVTKTQVGLGNVDDVKQLPNSYLDTDNTLSSNSDVKVASQKAVKAYIDTAIAAIKAQMAIDKRL